MASPFEEENVAMFEGCAQGMPSPMHKWLRIEDRHREDLCRHRHHHHQSLWRPEWSYGASRSHLFSDVLTLQKHLVKTCRGDMERTWSQDGERER